MLEHSGYSVLEAANGAEAVVLARERIPDLVLLDLQMPVKDGFDVLRELRADGRFEFLPIVAVTASAIYGDNEHAVKSGFTGYLTKPLNIFELRKELARLLPQTCTHRAKSTDADDLRISSARSRGRNQRFPLRVGRSCSCEEGLHFFIRHLRERLVPLAHRVERFRRCQAEAFAHFSLEGDISIA